MDPDRRCPLHAGRRRAAGVFAESVHHTQRLVGFGAGRHGVEEEGGAVFRLDGDVAFRTSRAEAFRLERRIQPVLIGRLRERRLSTTAGLCTM